MFSKIVISLFTMLLLFGCAPSNVVNVSSLAEVDSILKEQKEKSIASIGKDNPVTADTALLGVEFSMFGFRYLDETTSFFKTTYPGANLTLGWFTALDLLKLISDLKEYHNTIGVKVRFDRDVKFGKIKKDDTSSKLWDYNLWPKFSLSLPKPKCAEGCNWDIRINTTPEKFVVYRTADEALMTGKEFILILKYDDATKSLPEDDPCSLKKAEEVLVNTAQQFAQAKSKQ